MWSIARLLACAAPAPETEQELFREIGHDWCACAERDLPGAVSWEDTDQCATDLAAAALFFGSDDDCVFDRDAAADCVAVTRSAEVTCDEDTNVYYDGASFADIDACASAWVCAAP